MRVFLSSVISGFEHFRNAAAEAVEALGYEVIRVEDFAASPQTPQRACLAGVREADVVVLLLGGRYGDAPVSGLSPTHEEYREARDRRPVLAFVQEGVDLESRQQAFAKEVEAWAGGRLRSGFEDPVSLRRAVTRALHEWAKSWERGAPDSDEMLARARALHSAPGNVSQALLVVTIAGGPRQTILRPGEIEEPVLLTWLRQTLLFGDNAIFAHEEGNARESNGQMIEIKQGSRAGLYLNAEGSIRLHVPAIRRDERRLGAAFSQFSSALIEEEVREALIRCLHLASEILEHVDQEGRITRVVVSAATPGAGYLGWQTRAEAAASGGSVRLSMSGSDQPVNLMPPDRPRAALSFDTEAIAQDLTILLRKARGA